MSVKQVKKDFEKLYGELQSSIEELENHLNKMVALEDKHSVVNSALKSIKDKDSFLEGDDVCILVYLDKKVKAGKVSPENFFELFGEPLAKITNEVEGEVFQTSNSVGVFAKVDGENVTVTANRNNTVDALCVSVSGINENGLTIADTLKKKKPKMR